MKKADRWKWELVVESLKAAMPILLEWFRGRRQVAVAQSPVHCGAKRKRRKKRRSAHRHGRRNRK